MDADAELRRVAGLADAAELSASIGAAGVERRALFFLDRGPDAVAAVAAAARALGLPGPLLSAWRDALPGADAVGLALREDRRSVRLYVQHWDRLVARWEAGAPLGPLYAGFKALPGGAARVDAYHARPEAPRAVFWPPMRAALTGLGLEAEAVEAAFGPLSAETAILTRTEAPGRRSWLVTVRRAGLDRGAVRRALAPLGARPGLGDLVDGLADHALAHVAGGHDDAKGRFTTLYREAAPADALDRLTARPPAPGR